MTNDPDHRDADGTTTHFPLDEVVTLTGADGSTLRTHAHELTITTDGSGGLRSCDLRFRVTAATLVASGLLDRATDSPPMPEVADDATVEVIAHLSDGASTTANAATLRRALRTGGSLARLERWDIVAVRSPTPGGSEN